MDSQIEDAKHLSLGGLFPIVETKLGRMKRLIGIGAPTARGKFIKNVKVA